MRRYRKPRKPVVPPEPESVSFEERDGRMVKVVRYPENLPHPKRKHDSRFHLRDRGNR